MDHSEDAEAAVGAAAKRLGAALHEARKGRFTPQQLTTGGGRLVACHLFDEPARSAS
jgi:hypothetical protein